MGIVYETPYGTTYEMTDIFNRVSWKRKRWEKQLLMNMLYEMEHNIWERMFGGNV